MDAHAPQDESSHEQLAELGIVLRCVAAVLHRSVELPGLTHTDAR